MLKVSVSLKIEKRKKVNYYGLKLNSRDKPKEDVYPLVFEFSHKGKRSYLTTGAALTLEDYLQLKAGKTRKNWLKDLWSSLESDLVQLRDVSNLIKNFSIPELKKELGRNPEHRKDVFAYYENHIQAIKDEDRISTYRTYKTGLVSLRKFVKGRPVAFHELTPQLLNSYEKWAIIEQGNSTSTVGINMRSLRTVVNAAIEDGLMKLEDSPFGKKKYQIPASKNIKKALMLKQIREIMDFPSLEGSAEQKYRDMWLFLYFGNGMNVTDMCRLKNENLDSNSITFVRSKTRNSTRTSQTKIKVSLIDPLKVIIEKYRNTDLNPNGYLFPFLADTETETQIRDRVQSVNKRINKHMKAIGIKLKIEMPITSYTARHSFASSLKKGNQSATIIAEFLGHKNISTTQAYLGSIEDNQQDKIMQNLIPKK